jgi:phosphoribosylformylglycinamidine (FGAM) synthase PurS component
MAEQLASKLLANPVNENADVQHVVSASEAANAL